MPHFRAAHFATPISEFGLWNLVIDAEGENMYLKVRGLSGNTTRELVFTFHVPGNRYLGTTFHLITFILRLYIDIHDRTHDDWRDAYIEREIHIHSANPWMLPEQARTNMQFRPKGRDNSDEIFIYTISFIG